MANTLTDFNSLIGYISAGVILILLGVAVFLISNTITVGISVRKEEIAIMKLIGATDYFVRAPFVVEGIVIGLIGAAIPLGILYALYGKIVMYISDKFSFISNMMKFLSVNEIFHNLIPVALVLGVGIGFIGSRITIRKHLRYNDKMPYRKHMKFTMIRRITALGLILVLAAGIPIQASSASTEKVTEDAASTKSLQEAQDEKAQLEKALKEAQARLRISRIPRVISRAR